MAVQIIAQEDRGLETSSEGVTTFTRVMQLEGDSLMEIGTSKMLPQRGWRHPENSAFFLDSISIDPNGNKGRKVQALATLVYNNSAELLKEFNEDPWDIGAQNFNSRYVSITEPFIYGYNKDGKVIQNLNSANCRIIAETNRYIREITFHYAVEEKSSRDFEGTDEAIINKSSITVAGVKIEPLTGLLLPFDVRNVIEYEPTGDKIKRQYWDVYATIQINKNGWARRELNVGTMCFFKVNQTSKISRVPKQIYTFTPWRSKNSDENLKTQPRFGSIDDVISAKNYYASIMSGYSPETATEPATDDQTQKYQIAWDSLPFSEVTEPMPLYGDGTIYEQAIYNPSQFPYLELKIYDTKISSWKKFDLPKYRA